MEEIWCDISDYKGLYQVSTLGRVRSLDRIIYDQGRHWFQNGKILKAQYWGGDTDFQSEKFHGLENIHVEGDIDEH